MSFGPQENSAYQELFHKNLHIFIDKWKSRNHAILIKVGMFSCNHRMMTYAFSLDSLISPGQDMNYDLINCSFTTPAEEINLYL
jgi:hypothetical protein